MLLAVFVFQRFQFAVQKVLVECQPFVGQQSVPDVIVLGLRLGTCRYQTLLQHPFVQLDRFALLDQTLIVGVVELVLELLQESLEMQCLGNVLERINRLDNVNQRKKLYISGARYLIVTTLQFVEIFEEVLFEIVQASTVY